MDSLKQAARRQGVSMAELIRISVDRFLRRDARTDPEAALEATFGATGDLEVPPRAGWDRGHD